MAAPTGTSPRSRSPLRTVATAPRSRSTGATATTPREPQRSRQLHRDGQRRRRDPPRVAGRPERRYSLYSVPSNTLTANPGPNAVTVAVSWADTNERAQLPGGNQLPDRQPEHLQVQRQRARPPDVRRYARNRRRGRARPHLDSSWNSIDESPRRGRTRPRAHRWVHPSPSIRPSESGRWSSRTGVYTTLRLDDPQSNQTLQCDPQLRPGPGVHKLPLRLHPVVRRESLHGDNALPNPPVQNTPSWWNISKNKLSARRTVVLEQRPQRGGYGVNSSNNPWRCVLTAPAVDRPGRRLHGRRRPTTATTSTTTRARPSTAKSTGTTTARPGRRRAGSRPAATEVSARGSTCSSSRIRRARA